jgi:hypothetical protein
MKIKTLDKEMHIMNTLNYTWEPFTPKKMLPNVGVAPLIEAPFTI